MIPQVGMGVRLTPIYFYYIRSPPLLTKTPNWRACDDFFWVGGDKTQAKPESPPTQKKAELRIVRVRVPPSDGTEARGGSLGRARMCVCVVPLWHCVYCGVKFEESRNRALVISFFSIYSLE